MKKKTLQGIIRFLVNTLTKITYIDMDHIPAEGGVILALNHLSFFDTPVVLVNERRPDVTALVTTKYQKKFFISWFINTAKGIWINRDIADFSAIQKASKALKAGKAVGIAPEGTRSKKNQLQEGKPGTVMLAVKSGMPIVPLAITGTEDAFQKLLRFQRPTITVRFGKAFTIPPLEPGHRSRQLKEWTEIVMMRIAELLPESYQGVYRDKVG